MNIGNTFDHPKTTLAGFVIALTVAAPILNGFDWSHPTRQSLVGLAVAVVIAVIGALLKDPKSNSGTTAGVFLLMLLAPVCVAAQDAALPVPPITQLPVVAVGIHDLYGAGVSYSVNASPSVAGNAIYAHLLNADSGTYAFSAIDAVPNTLKPFTVNTNVGVGIAQKVLTLGRVPIFMPTAAGISWNGSNTGFQWNGGALAVIHLKNQYYLLPHIRFLKSAVSNGSGYQPIIGVDFGWGQ